MSISALYYYTCFAVKNNTTNHVSKSKFPFERIRLRTPGVFTRVYTEYKNYMYKLFLLANDQISVLNYIFICL